MTNPPHDRLLPYNPAREVTRDKLKTLLLSHIGKTLDRVFHSPRSVVMLLSDGTIIASSIHQEIHTNPETQISQLTGGVIVGLCDPSEPYYRYALTLIQDKDQFL